jgi:hypothetical protein
LRKQNHIYFQILFIIVSLLSCKAQTNQNITERETYKVCTLAKLPLAPKSFIKGRVHENTNYNNFIPYATVLIKGTKIYSTSDSLGFYSIDITGIADTAKKITLVCSYVAHENKEIIIDHKLDSTSIIDFKLIAKSNCDYPEVELKPKRKNK